MRDWVEILLRSLGLFFLTFLFIRIMGKRHPGKMTAFQLVNYIIIATIAALTSAKVITNIRLGLVALGVWIVLPILLDFMAVKSKVIHDFIYGKQTILIKKGKVMEENLKKAKLTGEELIRELRAKNAFSLADVEFAVLETTGEVNVVMKSDKKPITAHDLERKVAPQTEPQTIILDGNILYDALNEFGLNEGWLKTQLKGMGVDLTNVFIGQVDSSGDLYVDLFDDMIQLPQPSVKEMLYAGIEKSQADFTKYALETKDEKAKQMYSEHAKNLQELMKKLQPYLLR
ncbi:DUF421 domain-containing protein [Clostridium formicaceticum]|uniref:YetF C-terminal domain-containing protein n=1 Tax=Clostridium formicaceticum TaxID=1497 RepID=A0AAC9RIB2_9CLOT|nr:DUF421 domain-containing protein [Clostridium formicaceticum]AOY76212.1 hypothetical protein BJL90_10050 [Clostridium formicaceticum]ARE86591.1 hypothetical protein CLFO_09150 [Clostridium formicaceticum]